MKKLHKSIYKSFIGPFMIAFSVILFVLVLQFMSRYIDDLFGKDVELSVMGKIFFFACCTLITMAMPLAILLSSLLTMGNMGERYELAAMKSAGIGLFKTTMPMLNMTLVIVAFSMLCSFELIPAANLKLYSLIYDISRLKPSFNVRAGHFYRGIDNYAIHVQSIDRKRDILYGLKIYDHSGEAGNLKITLADSGSMKPNSFGTMLTLNLYSGVSHEESVKSGSSDKDPEYQYSRFYFDTLDYDISLTGFNLQETSEQTFRNHQYMLPLNQLGKAVDSLDSRTDTIRLEMANYMAKYVYMFPEKIVVPPEPEGIQVVDSTKNGLVNKWEKLVKDPPFVTPSGANNVVVDPTSTSNLFPAGQRVDIVNHAINNARAVKNYANVIKDRLEKEEEKLRKYKGEYQFRFVLPFACIVFLFIGAPLGAIIRKGGIGPPIIVSIMFFILFYILMIQGRKLARDGIIDVYIGTWLPIIVMLPMALVFTYSSATDSPLLFTAGWVNLFYKIKKRLARLNPWYKPAPVSSNAFLWDDDPMPPAEPPSNVQGPADKVDT